MIRVLLLLAYMLFAKLSWTQTFNHKYLHFTRYYYWDTLVYKTTQAFYYELNNGKIIENEYPVLEYEYTDVSNDSPFVSKDFFYKRDISHYPYRYIRKGKDIYVQYTDIKTGWEQLHKQYSLSLQDTIYKLADKSTLNNKSGISVGAYSYYLGAAAIKLGNKVIRVYRFAEDHQNTSHPGFYKKEVFLEQETLVPVKFVITRYDPYTRKKNLYREEIVYTSGGSVLPDYANIKAKDLVLYEDETLIWSARQQQEFLEQFSPGETRYADCMMKTLNGQVNFFKFNENLLYKKRFLDCVGKYK